MKTSFSFSTLKTPVSVGVTSTRTDVSLKNTSRNNFCLLSRFYILFEQPLFFPKFLEKVTSHTIYSVLDVRYFSKKHNCTCEFQKCYFRV